MLSPLPNSHRRNARKLGRGQYPRLSPVTSSIMNSGAIATIAFSAPVIVHARLDLRVASRTSLSQTIVSPTRVTQTFNADVSGQDFTFAPTTDAITTPTGAQVIGETGTFMINPDDVLHSAGGNYYPPAQTDVRNGVQYGVNATGNTGSYNPPLAPTLNPTTVNNITAGNYVIAFPEDITILSLTSDPAIQLYSPAANAWTSASILGPIGSNALIVSADNAATDCTYLLISATPTTFEFVNTQHALKNAPATAVA